METLDFIVNTFNSIFPKIEYPKLEIRKIVLPSDDTTLFICSGMQEFKKRFLSRKAGKKSTLQSCIRTPDLDLVGDGSHLTSFQMLGNFGFNTNDYEVVCLTWLDYINQLGISPTHITAHPNSNYKFFKDKIDIVLSDDNVWSDGSIGGNCIEFYVNDLEIGNLVNPLGHSVDVGFGLERLVQIIEKKSHIEDTSLFDQTLPIGVRDLQRTLELLFRNSVYPGAKGRNSVCRYLLRKYMELGGTDFQDWIREEEKLLSRKKSLLEKKKSIFHTKPYDYWYQTYGITQKDIEDFLKSREI